MKAARDNGLLQDFDNEQKEIVFENIENVKKVAEMRLMGRDRWGPEQYQLAFMIKHGILKLPDGTKPLWDPKAHMLEGDNEAAIKRGLFNVKRWLGNTKSGLYLRYHQDPFPDLPALNAWSFTGDDMPNVFGAGSKAQRWDLKPHSLSGTGGDIASKY